MRYFITWLLLMAPITTYSQKADLVIVNGVRGYVFPTNHTELIGNASEEYRFKPTLSELEELEDNLKHKAGDLTKYFRFKGKGCPNVKRNLRKYTRQYFGYIDVHGEKVIYIIFSLLKHKYSLSEDMRTKARTVYGGCSNYWQVKYNLSKGIFYDVYINEAD